MQSTEVVESLRNIRDQVETHLRNVREYRAFLAIQAAMDEISHVGELHSPLGDVQEGVKQRLNELREYRALLAVEKSITDISGVLGLLDEINPRPAAQPQAAAGEVSVQVQDQVQDQQQPVTAQTESAPQPAEAFVMAPAAEAAPALADFVAAAPGEVEAATTQAEPAATEFAISEVGIAAQAVDIVVPTDFAANPPQAFEAAPSGFQQHFDSQQDAAMPTPAQPIESAQPWESSQPIESSVPLEPTGWTPANEAPGFGSEHFQHEPHQQEPQQTVPDHDDPAIAKVA
jgi:hypothetical protein